MSAKGWIWPATANGPGNLIEREGRPGNASRALPGFLPSLQRTLLGSFDYHGRARRTDVAVYGVTVLWLVPLILSLGELVSGKHLPRTAELALGALFALPFATLFARRCHDSGRSGRWAWLLLPGLALPLTRGITNVAGGIPASVQLDQIVWPLDWLAIATNLAALALCAAPGGAGPNAFGEDPREPA